MDKGKKFFSFNLLMEGTEMRIYTIKHPRFSTLY